MTNDCCKFVRFVSDAAVVGYGDPSSSGHFAEPHIIRARWRKVVGVALDGQPCGAQGVRKLEAEVTVREEDNTQAARSYRIAFVMSASVTP